MERTNKMANTPMTRLVLGMSLPLMVSLLVQSLYNIVDSIFVASLSENALAATSLSFPVQMLMIALAVGTSVGINALLSRLLGQQKTEDVGYSVWAAQPAGIWPQVSGLSIWDICITTFPSQTAWY